MKIVDRKQFLTMPDGVLYSEYRSSGMVSELRVKVDIFRNDWRYIDLLSEVNVEDAKEYHEMYEEAENGKEFRLDYEWCSRDGSFQDDDMFMVYDITDLSLFIGKLTEIASNYPCIDSTESTQ